MKKLISAFTMMFLCSLSYAESMKFITVLSSPVGTFNKLEAVDPAQPATGNTVNFCTNIGTQGVVELKGTKPAALTTVSLSKNTTLGKTDEGKFSLNNITLKQGGSIKGGRLFGNTVTVNNAASGKANNLYGNQLTVAGAKTKTLDVNSGASKINGPGNSTGKEEMVWSNEYQEDDACKSGSACAKQYLLKSKGTSDLCSQTGYFMGHISECCQTTRTKTDEYFVRYPGADLSARTEECSAGSNSSYTCTTGDFVNKKICNEYVLDTNSGSSSTWRYPAGGSITGTWLSVQKSFIIPYQQECWSALPERKGCNEITMSSLNISGGDGFPTNLPEATSLCQTHYSPGGPSTSDGYETCTIPTCATTATGGKCTNLAGCHAQYYLSTLYCKNSSESASSSYHITVNRVECCAGR